MTIKMKDGMTYEDSKVEIRNIGHGSCEGAMENRWIKGGNAGVKAQSICWLYCWAKSQKAKQRAEAAFNTIFDKRYDSFNPDTMYEYAKDRKHRYADRNIDIEDEFAAVAKAALILKPNI